MQHSKNTGWPGSTTSRPYPARIIPNQWAELVYNGPISHGGPPTKASVETEDATAPNCLVLLTLCKAASIYAATGSHRQWRLNFRRSDFCIGISHIGWKE